MSEGTTARERNIMPKVGARFFRDGDDIAFTFVVDPNNVIGPRPATKADSEKHPEAWSAFAAAVPVDAEIEVVPDAREAQEPAPPETIVEPKEMAPFEAKLQPAPEPAKRAYAKRKVA